MPSPVFINYRRADQPFAAALIHTVLTDRWSGDPAFLDTRYLRQRGDVEQKLLAAIDTCQLVLAVIGPDWDSPALRERLTDPRDWVRRELIRATEATKQIVPVLVDRACVPTELPFTPTPSWNDPLHVTRTGWWNSADMLADRVAPVLRTHRRPDRPPRSPRELIEPVVDAMLRHVLPGPQRQMRNDAMIARVVAAELDEHDWLRFVAAANLPHRPNGSGIVWITTTYLAVADLDDNFHPRTPPLRVSRADLARADRRDRHRLWKRVTDIRFTLSDGRQLDIAGFFTDEADELLTELGLGKWANRKP